MAKICLSIESEAPAKTEGKNVWKKKKKSCAGINSFSGGAAAGIGARELLSASLLSAEHRLG